MPKICRACESKNISSREITSEYAPLFGSPFTFQESIDTCLDCHLEGDFEMDPRLNNDARFDSALSEAQRQDSTRLIESLKDNGIRMARAERALGLPQRTMFRWKNEGITSAAFALLKIVSEFPTLIEVCEQKFSRESKREFFWTQSICVQTSSSAESTSMKTYTDTARDYPTPDVPVAA